MKKGWFGFFLWVSGSLFGAPADLQFSQSSDSVALFDFLEITIRAEEPDVLNPFTEVAITGEFTREVAEPVMVDGFCDSEDGSVFRIRFMPMQAGSYTYSIEYRQDDFRRQHSGTFTAQERGRRGVLRVDEDYPWHFVWQGTGEHYFWNGTTTYYLMGWQRDEQIREIIDRLHRLKVNRLRVLLYGRNRDEPWDQPVRTTEDFHLYLNPWPAERPAHIGDPGFDLLRFNVEHWQKYERLLRYAREKDVIVSVIFFIGGQVLPTPFEAHSEEELLYYRYGVARLAAFSNVTWDLGNEHDFHREVPDWADRLGPRVKEWDPYDHLTSAHNRVFRTPGKEWNDLQLIQRWDEAQNEFMISQQLAQAATGRVIPQINEEYGYEDLWEREPGQRSAETRRKLAWEISMAGAYQTTGETAERGTGFESDSGGGWVNGRGDETMTMLEGYAHIVEFFAGFEWWKTVPRNDLVDGGAFCLAEPGQLYALYLPESRRVTVRLEDGLYQGEWFNARTGERRAVNPIRGSSWTSPIPPDEGDWAILIRRTPPRGF